MADVQHRSLHVHAILQAYTASKDLTIRFDLYCDLKFILRSTSIKANFWRNTLSQQRLHLCIVLSAMESWCCTGQMAKQQKLVPL